MSGDVRLDSKSEDHEKEANLDFKGNEFGSNGEPDPNESCDADNSCLIKIGDIEQGFKEVTVTTDIAILAEEDYIAELKKKISHLEVELSLMHRENDNITRDHQEKLAEIKGEYDEKIRAHNESLHTAEKKNEELKSEICILTGKLESKCNVVRTLETAQTNLEMLVQNKDEIIESQKLIIKGVRKEISTTDCLKSKLAEATLAIAEKDSALASKHNCDHENCEVRVERLSALEKELRCMESKLEDQTVIRVKTELAYITQEKLLLAKDEIISNLKELNSQQQSRKVESLVNNSDGDSMTSNSKPATEIATKQDVVSRSKMIDLSKHYDAKIKLMSEQSDLLKGKLADAQKKLDDSQESRSPELKNGVKECCEFIEVHAVNGAITNGFLLWADIQRKQHPEKIWKEEAAKKFVNREITEAKEALWRISGETLLGKMIKRQGNSKLASEVNDICIALKTLSEKDALPMFIGTSLMVSQTPIYQLDLKDTTENKKLESIEKSLNSILNEINARSNPIDCSDDKGKNNVIINDGDKQIGTALCETMAVDDINAPSSSTWSTVDRRRGNRFSQAWRENNKRIPPSQTNLVVSGVELGMRGLQIAQYLENKDINVYDWSLLTTRDDASFLTFKITVKKDDVDKLKDQSLWLDGWQIRPYKPPKMKKKERNDTERNKTAENRDNSSISGNTSQKDSSAEAGSNFRYDMLQFPTLLGNIPEEIPPTGTYNWPYRRTGLAHHDPEAARKRSLQSSNNHPGNAYPTSPNGRNNSFDIPSNGMQGRNISLRNYAPDHTMENVVGRNSQMGSYQNTPLVNVPGSQMNNFVGQSTPIRNNNTVQVSQGNPWYDTGLVNNQYGILDGRTIPARPSFPGIVKREVNWSNVCDSPIRFVDGLGTDQFIQQQ